MRGAAIPSLHPVAALVSGGTTAAILAALVAAGILSAEPKPKTKSLTVISLAALSGSETGEAETRPAEPQPEAAQPAPPVLPSAVAAPATPEAVPAKPLPAVMPVAMAAPAAPAAAAVAPASAPASAPAAASAPTAAPAAPAAKGVRDGLRADGPSGTSRAYAARVRSWLLSHKIYPKYARMRHLQGVVRVRFVLDRAGRLVEGGLLGGSGEKTLDAEGEAMLRRASPYPAAPADVAGERIAFTAAIAFELTD